MTAGIGTVTAVAAVALAAGGYAGFKLSETSNKISASLTELLLSIDLADAADDADRFDQ